MGGALGAALYTWYDFLNNPRHVDTQRDSQKGSYFGPEYNNEEIQLFLDEYNIPHSKQVNTIIDTTADLLIKENVIGWFQGEWNLVLEL